MENNYPFLISLGGGNFFRYVKGSDEPIFLLVKNLDKNLGQYLYLCDVVDDNITINIGNSIIRIKQVTNNILDS